MKLLSTVRVALLTLLSCAAMGATAQGTGDYPIGFDADAVSSHGSHYPGKVTVTTTSGNREYSFGATAAGHRLYYDGTESFVVEAEAGSRFTVAYGDPAGGNTENWMHLYVYLDYGQDGQFSYHTNGHQAAAGSDLVAWSFYHFEGNSDTGGWNSAGTYLTGTGRNTKVLPNSIAAPAAPGDYRVRVKMAWSDLDPAGNTALKNDGGFILDFTLRVTGAAYTLTYEDTEGTTLDYVRVGTTHETFSFGSSTVLMAGSAPTTFTGHDWQVLSLVNYRVGRDEYTTWGSMVDAVPAPADVVAVLNVATKDYYPDAGKSYYIAAQTWNGQKWVERLLVNSSGTTLGQTTDLNAATAWTAEKGVAAGDLRLKSPTDQYIMYGGLNSTACDVMVDVPGSWTSGQHAQSLTIYSKAGASGDWRYVIARNSGADFESGDKSNAETGLLPKSSNYTPYYRFYESSQRYVSVNAIGSGAATYTIGGETYASDVLIPVGDRVGQALGVVGSSYNAAMLRFDGFYDGATLLGETYTIPEGTGHRNLTARFSWRMIGSTYGEKWMKIRSNALGTYAATYDDDGTTRIKPQTLIDGEDIFKWCFVEAEGGFYIYNKGVGSGSVVTLDGDAGDGTAISMQPVSDTNPERQVWTLVYDGTSVGIVPANHQSRGWNPYAGNTNPLKLYDVTGNNSRWQLIETGKSLMTDREGNFIEDGVKYTFISAYPEYYNRQKVYKAVYLGTDNKLYWKNYDPSDDTFYFRAHVADDGTVTMECVGKAGYYLTGPATDVAETGNAFTLTNLGNGICNIMVNGGSSFHTNNHGGGSGGSGNVIAYPGGVGSASVWYVQRADMKAVEVARYQQELADRQAAIDEAERQAKRAELKVAIESAVVGYGIGQYPPDAIEAAQAVYDDETKTTAEYQAAITTLQRAINPPQTHTYYRFRTAFAWNDAQPRFIYVGKNNELRWQREKESLYQLWQVAAVNENDHSNIAFVNLGSGTYLKATVSNGVTTTSNAQSFVMLMSNNEGSFYIKSLTPADGMTRFHTGDHGGGAGAEGRIMLWDANGDRNTWLLEEVSEMDMSTLAYDEDNRQAARDSLLACISEIQQHSTTNNSIAYRSLSAALATAQAVYDDPSNTKAEYLAAIDALRAADAAASVIEPVEGQTYVLMKADGSLAMFMDNADAEEEYGRIAMNIYDDTDALMLWTITHGEGHAYTFTCNGVSVTLHLTPAGNDQYEVEGLSDVYGNFVIRRCSVGTNHDYLTTGTYRIVNVNSGKALANNALLVARTALADVDETCTDHLQIWTVTKLPGADRYMMQNVETGRYLGQSDIAVGTLVGTMPLSSVFRLEESDIEGQYYIYTTQGMSTQLCVIKDGNDPRLKAAEANGKWTFVPVEPQEKPVVRYQAVRIRNREASTHYMSAVEFNVAHKAINISANDEKDMWVLVPHDFTQEDGTTETRYAIRNAFSGLYMQNVTTNDQKVSAGTTPVYYIKTAGTLDATAVEFKSPTNAQKLNASGANDYIIGWNGADDPRSHWYIEDVEGKTFTEDELMVRADAYEGFCAPRDGLICRIYNPNRGTYLDEDYNARGPRHYGLNEAKYTQLWRLHYDEAEAMYSLENLYTGDYLINQPWNNVQYYMTDDIATAGMFTLACNPTIVGQRMYNIIDSRSGRYVHAQATGLCVTWSAGNNSISASEWRFRPVELTDEEIAAIKAKWEENRHMTQNVGTYQTILDEIFADKACTTIKNGLTDERYEELVAQLPDLLADMCRKVKDNAWAEYPSGRNWEKAFRIAEHGVVSNSGAMSGLVAVDYGFSRLSDPTGIHAAANEVVAFMVDSDVQGNASLMVECQNGFGMSGGQYTLHKGLNLIAMDTETNMFICYMINSGADNPANYIENFPDIKIHIEGGTIFGKLDRTRVFEVENGGTVERYDMLTHHAWSAEAAAARAKADELWVNMKADGLLANNYMTQVRSECILFNFTSTEFLAACPEKIGEVTDIWDWMIKSQQFVMGMRNNWTLEGQNGELIDTYIPNLSKRFNNCYMATERSGGYMNATGYGAMYTVGTAGSILNFNNLKAGGAIWGPAHEHGHDHQKLINMIGMSEVSNNLLSNVSNYYHGTLVSRGASLPDVMNNYVNGGHWFDLSIWNMTQMYYKLFLYYHAAHNNDEFYPLVFKKLRDGERIRRVQGTAVGAHEDYLRFALACAEAAQEDLSDFFEAYGMFREISPEVSNIQMVEKNGKQCRYVGDYGDFYIYTDMDKVAEMKAKIQACGPRNTTVLFAEDRVSREPATNPFSNKGDMKGNRGDGGVVGAYGNVGQYTDMDKSNPDYDEEKTTGYMIYDEDGNLLYFTATEKDGEPVIPQVVIDKAGGEENIVVAEVESNGDVIEQADPEAEVYTITTYSYDNDGVRGEKTINSAGRMKPALKANDVAVVTLRDDAAEVAARRIIYSRDRKAAARRLVGELSAYHFADVDNVIMSDEDGHLAMYSLAVTDKQPLYLPTGSDDNGPLTENITYSRTNTAGWNSVCLPFATTAEDFGEGAQIYTLRAQDNSTITLSPIDRAEAAEPCYVLCPDEVNSWSIVRTLGDYTTTELSVKVADDVQLNGSFENRELGAGKYKMNTLGNKFGITTEGAIVTAFRSYIEAVEGANLSARQFTLRIEDDTATGVETIERTMQQGQMYDLSGRAIDHPVPGKPYILDGKVMIK